MTDAPSVAVVIGAGGGIGRPLRDFDPMALARILAVDTIGRALVLKHFSALLARDRPAVFALLSARLAGNRCGGRYTGRCFAWDGTEVLP